MQKDVPFSSKRFMLTLALCACSVILLQNHDLDGASFPLNLISLAAGLALCFLMLLPAVFIKKRYDSDALTLLLRRKSFSGYSARVVYCVYFIFAALCFLRRYTDMFCKKYYTETSPVPVALLLLVCCVYAAYKGVNVLTRFGIFLFALAMVTNALLFGGSLSSLDFMGGELEWRGGFAEIMHGMMYFVTPSFIAVLFACFSQNARKFRVGHIVTALLMTGLKFAAVLFFIAFAVGEYASRQEYQTFVLSRVAHLGSFAGIESFYMALATMSVFMIVSLFLCGMSRAVGKSGNLKLITVSAAAVFAFHWLAVLNEPFGNILFSPAALNFFTFITAVVIPVAVLVINGKKNMRKSK